MWWLKRLFLVIFLCLAFPAVEVAVVGFIKPPTTAPMTLRWLAGRFHSDYQPNQYHWIPLAHAPELYVATVYIVEDRHFFQHWGFDWEEIARARDDAKASGKPPRGASTITQQCARSLFLWQGRSWFRKGLEAYYTVWMELLLSKRRILELYVNVIELGDGIYGVEAAAQKYYGVPASQLTREQAAMLIAIMPDPKHRNPLNPDEQVLKRKEMVQQRMEYARLPISLNP